MTDDVITYTYIEEVVFLGGGLRDVLMRQEWSQGVYAYRLPGMRHGPHIVSEKGCHQVVKIVPVESL